MNNLLVNIMIGLIIWINFMYIYNVMDLVCINFFLWMGKKKEKWKLKKWNIEYFYYRNKKGCVMIIFLRIIVNFYCIMFLVY